MKLESPLSRKVVLIRICSANAHYVSVLTKIVDGVTLITINDAIAALRQELAKAAAAAIEQSDGGILMTVEEAHVELQVTLTTEVKGTAEVNVWVLKLGSQAGGSTADSHKLTVILKPRALDGGPVRVASKGPALPTTPRRGE